MKSIRILVVDDQLGVDEILRAELMRKLDAREIKSIEVARAENAIEVLVVSGQRNDGEARWNDAESTIDIATRGCDPDGTAWALILIDVQFEERDLEARVTVSDFGLRLFEQLAAHGLARQLVLLTSRAELELPAVRPRRPYLWKQARQLDRELRAELVEKGCLTAQQLRRLLRLDENIVIGESMRPIYSLALRCAWDDPDGGINPVLIVGDTGTGKEHLARFIHDNSRPGRPFIAKNAAAIPADLLEGELFGAVRGAFTGAIDRMGWLEQAGDGTLFLDEIGELATPHQAKLLRVAQTGTFSRVGEATERVARCRLVFATNANLEMRAAQRQFRHDLAPRIGSRRIDLIPLRMRTRDEILISARTYLAQILDDQGKEGISLAQDAERHLLGSTFERGNFRELQALLRRAVTQRNTNQVITAEDLAAASRSIEGITGKGMDAEGRPPNNESNQQAAGEGHVPQVDATRIRGSALPGYIEAVSVSMEDPRIAGLAGRIDQASKALTRRIAGALLERHRRADGTFNRQRTVQDLENDPSLTGAFPNRRLNAILGKRQDAELSDIELEQLVREWREKQ